MNGRAYLWVKAGHVIAVIAWYAGLFYIFRLFVYHVQHRHDTTVRATLEVMERRLMRGIMLPAMVVATCCGLVMIVAQPVLLRQPWMHAKLAAVCGLFAYHAYAASVRRRFAAGDFIVSETACRVINEVPTLLLFVIVIAVIVRP